MLWCGGMPDKGGLQLLPETRKKIEIKVPKRRRFFTISLIILFLIIGGLIGSFYYKGFLKEELMALDLQIENIDKNRNRDVEKTLLTLEKQLSLISELLDNHVFWSAGFHRLEKLTKPEVVLKDINTDITGSGLQIKATAKDFITIAKLIASYNSDDSIKDINITDANLLPDGFITFNMRLTFDESKFLRK